MIGWWVTLGNMGSYKEGQNIFQSPHSIVNFISTYLGELQVINAKSSAVTMHRSANPRRWLPSLAGIAEINVDAAMSRQ